MRSPRTFWRSLTYEPKIKAVLEGKCTQTIRAGRSQIIGDRLGFHGWEGTPYRSKWSFRTPRFPIIFIQDIFLDVGGIRWISPGGFYLDDGTDLQYDCMWWSDLDHLALLDGIDPPTGKALGELFNSMYDLQPGKSIEAQIIRWDPAPLWGIV